MAEYPNHGYVDNTFNSTRGYPGEGPARTKKTQERKGSPKDDQTVEITDCEYKVKTNCDYKGNHFHLRQKKTNESSSEQKEPTNENNSNALRRIKKNRLSQPCLQDACMLPHYHRVYNSKVTVSKVERGVNNNAYVGPGAEQQANKAEEDSDFVVSTAEIPETARTQLANNAVTSLAVIEEKGALQEDYTESKPLLSVSPSSKISGASYNTFQDFKRKQQKTLSIQNGLGGQVFSSLDEHKHKLEKKTPPHTDRKYPLRVRRDSQDSTPDEDGNKDEAVPTILSQIKEIGRPTQGFRPHRLEVNIFTYSKPKRRWSAIIGNFFGWAFSVGPVVSKISASTSRQRIALAQVYMSSWGNTWGQTTEVVDALRAVGYTGHRVGLVFKCLVDKLLSSDLALPRATDGEGNPTQMLLEALQVTVRNSHKEYMTLTTLADRNTLTNTYMYVYNCKLLADVMLQSLVLKRNVTYEEPGGHLERALDRGLYKWRKVGPSRDFKYADNGNFRKTGTCWDANEQLIPESLKPKRRQKAGHSTVMGPFYPSNLRVYEDTPENLRDMLNRLTCKRKPEVEGWHDRLVENQGINYNDEQLKLTQRFSHVIDSLLDIKKDENDLMAEAVENAAPDKKKLYGTAYKSLVDRNLVLDASDSVKENEIKLKNEKAKFDKAARAYVNLKIESPLTGGEVTRAMKKALAKKPVVVGSVGEVEFIPSPTQKTMARWVQLLQQPTLDYHAFVHSDDASLIVRLKNGRTRSFNIDISGCDSSHGPAIWASFELMFEHRPLLYAKLLRQLMRPLKLVSKNWTVPGRLIPLQPFLASGHSFTTLLNSFVLMSLIAQMIEEGVTTKKGIQALAERYGYILTVDECHYMEDNQLLKTSPAMDTAQIWRPLKNFAVYLRASGICKNDMVGAAGPWKPKAKQYAYGTLKSYSTGVTCPMFKTMLTLLKPKKLNALVATIIKKEFEYKVDLSATKTYNFTNESILSRYSIRPGHPERLGMTQREMTNFAATIQYMDVGRSFQGHATRCIYKMDYSLDLAPELYSTCVLRKHGL